MGSNSDLSPCNDNNDNNSNRNWLLQYSTTPASLISSSSVAAGPPLIFTGSETPSEAPAALATPSSSSSNTMRDMLNISSDTSAIHSADDKTPVASPSLRDFQWGAVGDQNNNSSNSSSTNNNNNNNIKRNDGHGVTSASSSKSSSPIVPVDIFVRHPEPHNNNINSSSSNSSSSDKYINTNINNNIYDMQEPNDVGNNKQTVTQSLSSTSSSSSADLTVRPTGLLARAQLFFQKQLDSLTNNSNSNSDSGVTTTTTTTTTTTSNDAVAAVGAGNLERDLNQNNVNSTTSSDDKLTDVTNNTDSDQCHLTSFETDTLSSASTNSALSHRSTNGLPPPNARHVIPEKMVRITNREKSPYRLMPDVLKNRNNGGGKQNNSSGQHQHYLSAGSSPASSLGKYTRSCVHRVDFLSFESQGKKFVRIRERFELQEKKIIRVSYSR